MLTGRTVAELRAAALGNAELPASVCNDVFEVMPIECEN